MVEYRNYIVANFKEYFDLFSVTKQATNDNLKQEFNIGDNVHLNNLGHHDCGQFVLNSPYYLFTEMVKQNTSAFFSMVLQKWHSLF